VAEMVGTTRSRVSFFMNTFRKLGFIHYKGGLQVHSSLLNRSCTTIPIGAVGVERGHCQAACPLIFQN
jgi:hypothetical protein